MSALAFGFPLPLLRLALLTRGLRGRVGRVLRGSVCGTRHAPAPAGIPHGVECGLCVSPDTGHSNSRAALLFVSGDFFNKSHVAFSGTNQSTNLMAADRVVPHSSNMESTALEDCCNCAE